MSKKDDIERLRRFAEILDSELDDLTVRIDAREMAHRNLLASLECTDSHQRTLELRVAALEDWLCTPQCPSWATSRHMPANNDSNQSDSSGSVGQSADLRTRIAAWMDDRLHLFTKPCRGCSDQSFHTAHLTWLGRKRWTMDGRNR